MIIDMLKFLLEDGRLSKAEISRRTGIPVPTQCRIMRGGQIDVYYGHGKALERVTQEVRDRLAQNQKRKKAA